MLDQQQKQSILNQKSLLAFLSEKMKMKCINT